MHPFNSAITVLVENFSNNKHVKAVGIPLIALMYVAWLLVTTKFMALMLAIFITSAPGYFFFRLLYGSEEDAIITTVFNAFVAATIIGCVETLQLLIG